MVSIKDLRDELNREKNLVSYEEEKQRELDEKKRLSKELSDLKFKRRYGKQIETGKKVYGGIKSAFGEVAKVAVKARENQDARDRQERAIKKRGYGTNLQGSGLGFFR